MADAKQYCREEATYIILGNKADKDVEGLREVEYYKASGFAQDNDCLMFETSALTGANIDAAFNKLVETIIMKNEQKGDTDLEMGTASESRSLLENQFRYR